MMMARTNRFCLHYWLFVVLLSFESGAGEAAPSAPETQEKLISLNFQDVPLRQVLQVLADFKQFNLVVSDSVTGNLTLRLEQVPWPQALNTILRLKGLDRRQEGNILLVAPVDELAAYEARRIQAGLQITELAPLHSVLLAISYARATEVAALLQQSASALLSERGRAVVDERTNSLWLTDTDDVIQKVRLLLKELDVPVRQVEIESRMVMLRDSVTDELGVRWGSIRQPEENWHVNLPVHAPAGSIAFHIARLANDSLLDLELTALQLENQGEIIASPRITTANQKQASIEQGVEIPYVQAAASGATAVEFKKAVLSLTVTPHITPDNRIMLDLKITQNTRGETVQTATGPATAIDTQQIRTQVLVTDGETIVLGGIYQQQLFVVVTRVPWLGDLPFIGTLFRNTRQVTEKSELLIFVTPRILP